LHAGATDRIHRPVTHRGGHDIAILAGTDHQNTAWCRRNCLPPEYPGRYRDRGRSAHDL
jgi:hypothetical protein